MVQIEVIVGQSRLFQDGCPLKDDKKFFTSSRDGDQSILRRRRAERAQEQLEADPSQASFRVARGGDALPAMSAMTRAFQTVVDWLNTQFNTREVIQVPITMTALIAGIRA